MSHSARKREYISQTNQDFEILRNAVSVLKHEANELLRFTQSIPLEFAEAVRIVQQCNGCVVVAGIGKAGWIAQKISATLASTGTPSQFLHPAEAFHGDFGRVTNQDIVLILSNSGETEEITKLLPTIKQIGAKIISITNSDRNSLGRASDCVIGYGKVNEACPNGLAPSTSTTLMLGIGDALALSVSRLNNFSPVDFAKFHPGGSLGRKLQTVDEVMRPLVECRTSSEAASIRETLACQAREGRRTGAILITDNQGVLSGIFTDSDLVRILEQKQDPMLDQPVTAIMTRNPIQIASGEKVDQAIEILSSKSISELPVVSSSGKPIGLIDITDVIA